MQIQKAKNIELCVFYSRFTVHVQFKGYHGCHTHGLRSGMTPSVSEHHFILV